MEDEEGFISGKMPMNPVGHMRKRARSNAGVVAVFDEEARRDFVTGFRKRKQERRKQALVEQEKKNRGKRIRERAERRLQLRIARGEKADHGDEAKSSEVIEDDKGEEQAGEYYKSRSVHGIEQAESDEASGGEAEGLPRDGNHNTLEGVTTYDNADGTTVVTTSVMDPFSDEREVRAHGEGKGINSRTARAVSGSLKLKAKLPKPDRKLGKAKSKKRGLKAKKEKSQFPKAKSKKVGKGKGKGRKKT